MKKKILIFLCVLIISACGDKTESQLKNEAKEAVTKKLSQNYKPDECRNWKVMASREGANKQVISSQADSLIKISRIWADFFPANTSNQPI